MGLGGNGGGEAGQAGKSGFSLIIVLFIVLIIVGVSYIGLSFQEKASYITHVGRLLLIPIQQPHTITIHRYFPKSLQ